MLDFISKRLLGTLILLFVLSVLTFVIIQLPSGDYGDLVKNQAMTMGGASPAQAELLAEQARERFGLNDPLIVQYGRWIGNIVFHFDFGHSFAYNKPVMEVVGDRLPRTLAIALSCHIGATLLGVLAGIYAARRQNKVGDRVATLFSFIAMTVPRFVMAIILVYFMVFVWDVGSIGAMNSPQYMFEPMSWAKFWDTIVHIWPVILIAAFGGMAFNLRIMRGNLLDVLKLQYVETARAKGLTENRVIYKHAVPNAMHSLVSYQGVALPYMITGEMEAAMVLGIPTIGPLIISAMAEQDVYVIGTIMLLIAALLVIGNLIADILLAVLDPRIRLA
ncbi:ABC transporter permease [Vibrio sp. qd031]|jgi:peptide/nickel transport system permease protein|uniref:ABC transporter permease n=1 Tax=Vibrio ulleungensis TaxID=2807619 RepID=A0ABS2HND7_9VIBR|nr:MULTISPECIES: ABC transporter permease [Vibrio]MBM7037407.1 ABC transporter permease [Vibrio ulleungensis]ORT48257.1 ABC transporter permease [Vibrio sp. qd031]